MYGSGVICDDDVLGKVYSLKKTNNRIQHIIYFVDICGILDDWKLNVVN